MIMNMSCYESVCNMTGPRSDSWESIQCRGIMIFPLLPTVLVPSHILQILTTVTVFNIQHSSINNVTQLGDSSTCMKKRYYKYLTAKFLGHYSNLTKIN